MQPGCGEDRERLRMAEEDLVQERVDPDGSLWRKVYFGGGPHFRNWLEQSIELAGERNVRVEETDSRGLACFEEAGENMYRIWVRVSKESS